MRTDIIPCMMDQMKFINLFFRAHIPYRLRSYPGNSTVLGNDYFDHAANEEMVNQVADYCYIPVNDLLLSLVRKNKGAFKINFSISGCTLELLQEYRPDVINSFKKLAATGCVEFLAETYYNSLSWLYSKKEFEKQVRSHSRLIKKLFAASPVIFRNTELIYNNELASFVSEMGYKAVFCDGNKHSLKGRTPNKIYSAKNGAAIKLILRNVPLSDDIAFRFDDTSWSEYPLTSDKFASWIHNHGEDTKIINLMLDYETFGLHKKASSGILEFLEYLPEAILKNEQWAFGTASEILYAEADDVYDVPEFISWNDRNYENNAWYENVLQHNMFKKIYSLEKAVTSSRFEKAGNDWGKLQSVDHFYNMSANGIRSQEGILKLNPLKTPEEAYKNYMNIIAGLEIKLIREGIEKIKALQPKSIQNILY